MAMNPCNTPARLALALTALLMGSQLPAGDPPAVQVRGIIMDATTQRPLPARLYLQREDGKWFFARSEAPDGSAVHYQKQRGPQSVEMHTTLSAHPFTADLPPGRYTVTVEHGKEFHTLTREFEVKSEPLTLELPLRRWIHMAERGWFSGDTHVHRTLEELPNAMLADDLNVALPLTYWVTRAFEPPARGDKNTADTAGTTLIKVDDTHVIYPRNTEYEIFTVDGHRHTLGAVFVLNHQTVFDLGAPPVKPIAQRARAEGALLDLDKHNWPWSLALIPVMGVDLFELSNNHVWRTQFAFTNWASGAPAYMNVHYDGGRGSEEGWVHFGFQSWYALLNSGYRLRPTAGNASGVHPVPLGFGRVYVYLPEGFSYEAWIKGLDAGRSFVTTGPMLLAKVNGQQAGHVFRFKDRPAHAFHVMGTTHSERPLTRLEVVVNGEVVEQLRPANHRTPEGAFENSFNTRVELRGSGWITVRGFEQRPGGRFRFAHTAPWHVEVENQPLRPRKEEIAYLIQTVADELARSRDVLPVAALAEYEEALAAYRRIAETAR
jgi:hypothetical protein